jgi:hypothetical protein
MPLEKNNKLKKLIKHRTPFLGITRVDVETFYIIYNA